MFNFGSLLIVILLLFLFFNFADCFICDDGTADEEAAVMEMLNPGQKVDFLKTLLNVGQQCPDKILRCSISHIVKVL